MRNIEIRKHFYIKWKRFLVIKLRQTAPADCFRITMFFYQCEDQISDGWWATCDHPGCFPWSAVVLRSVSCFSHTARGHLPGLDQWLINLGQAGKRV